jgi:three-Cys-motif partner protein
VSSQKPALEYTSTNSRAGTFYLDLFAGQAQNVSRSRDEHSIRGSARRALDTEPPFTVLRFFEFASRAATLDSALKAEYPDRDFSVVPGDCNIVIDSALSHLFRLNWAPTFAFLDQQSTEVQWSTLQRLARHKRADKPKTELWLLCASGLLPRGLKIRADTIDTAVADQVTCMFGSKSGRRRSPQRVMAASLAPSSVLSCRTLCAGAWSKTSDTRRPWPSGSPTRPEPGSST